LFDRSKTWGKGLLALLGFGGVVATGHVFDGDLLKVRVFTAELVDLRLFEDFLADIFGEKGSHRDEFEFRGNERSDRVLVKGIVSLKGC